MIPKFNDSYLDTFFEEKRLRERVYDVVSSNGTEHSIPTGVVLEHIALTRGREREDIKDIIRKIDFANGDLHHFFRHLAAGIVANYRGVFSSQKKSSIEEDLLIMGSENPELQKNLRPILEHLEKTASRVKTASFSRIGDQVSTYNKEALTMLRVRKRSTLGDIFLTYLEELSINVEETLGTSLEAEHRLDPDMGFLIGNIEFGPRVDVVLKLAPDYVKLVVKGTDGSTPFSSVIRVFPSDPMRKTLQRIMTKIPAGVKSALKNT